MTKKRFCFICHKPCAESDLNVDGTYAHSECLRANMTHTVVLPKKK